MLISGSSFFFFGGLSIPLSQAILAHLFSYNMTWGATKKEVERSNFFKEVPKIMKRCVTLLIHGALESECIIVQLLVLLPRFPGHHCRHDSLCHIPCAAWVASEWLRLGSHFPIGVR